MHVTMQFKLVETRLQVRYIIFHLCIEFIANFLTEENVKLKINVSDEPTNTSLHNKK